MSHSVGRVADLAGVTVRALHHYDQVGLLRPSGRTHSGHRQYEDGDLERLRQILIYRELGFTLDEIAEILSEGDPSTHLQRQHELLEAKMARLREMITALEYLMEAQTVGMNLTPEEKLELFGDFDPDAHAAEAQERWGHTDAYKESARRAAGYSKQDWARLQQEATDQLDRWVQLLASGASADSPQAMDLAELHRQQITTNFYTCTLEIHTGLADMFIADPRFRAYYDSRADGLAQFVHDAIHANAITRA